MPEDVMMRFILLLSVFIASPVVAGEWKTDFFSISIPSKFHIEETGEAGAYAAFVPDERYGHPKEMLVLKFGKPDDFNDFIAQSNEVLSELGGKLEENPCKPNCVLYSSETQLENNETSQHHFLRVVKALEHAYVITYFGELPKNKGRNFINNVVQQINANGI